MNYIKLILFTILLSSCSQTAIQNKKSSPTFTKEERDRINFYRNLRLKKRYEKVNLNREERMILEQVLSMKCYKKRLSKKSCNKFLVAPPNVCLKVLRKKRYLKFEKCIEKSI